ncbi:MAG: aminomethyl-transferring glycine dehydrogenase subunit GcvPA [Firmicutes bacterium]|nr:aminomethyl-transferring glycine dehydrogenase subunit GcvPA [Bacillota bacterium]MBR0127642.1 aminomethyl-transferring glycine dehydrogenase subunit GcvPA [Bacillota bacterium]
MGTFVPNTKEQQLEMLREIGYEKLDDLFAHIPDDVKFQGELDLPAGMSEMEVAAEMQKIADKNVIYQSIFRGAGAYKHYIPAIVGSVISNETLQTAYTPYQAEISQGVLQSIFEYQTMICDLTGMDVSNASVYDGATAAGEAVAMCRERKQNKALISGAIQPSVMKVIETYCFGNEMELEVIEVKDGKTDLDDLKAKMSDEIACVYIQHPNYFGNLEDAAEIGEIAHSFKKCKYIMGVNPISLGILKTPREYGADFAVGEGQPLGLPIAFGGPYLGFMASVDSMKRKLPGRIVGQTVDHNGKTGYVLTLQAREQHIRREKASSNICSNQALCALAVGVYLAAMGNQGIRDVATQCYSKAHYMAKRMEEIGFTVENKDYFHEFVTTSETDIHVILKALSNEGILGGQPLDLHRILWCCTEMNSKADIDRVIDILKEV